MNKSDDELAAQIHQHEMKIDANRKVSAGLIKDLHVFSVFCVAMWC